MVAMVLALFLLPWSATALVPSRALPPARRGVDRVGPLRSVPDWEAIQPEAERQAKRSQEVRDKMAKLRAYKKQGRRYDGTRVDDAEKLKTAAKSPEEAAAATEAAEASSPLPPSSSSASSFETNLKQGGGSDVTDSDSDDVTNSIARVVNEAEARFGVLATAPLPKDTTTKLAKKDASPTPNTESETRFPTTAKQSTSGVGGTWTPPSKEEEADTDMHEPAVSTWGRFPRPKDMSKAYGGGKRIGVGVPRDEEAAEARLAKTKALLAKYRERAGEDQRIIDENREAIELAMTKAKRFIAKGRVISAVEAFEDVEKFCTPRTDLGARALLDLALAHEACGDAGKAREIYGRLSSSPISDVKQKAAALSFGFEAQEKLGVQSYKGSDAAKEALGVYTIDMDRYRRESKKVMLSAPLSRLPTADPMTKEEQNEVLTFEKAFEYLRSAGLATDTYASADRVAKALNAFDDNVPGSLFDGLATALAFDNETDIYASFKSQALKECVENFFVLPSFEEEEADDDDEATSDAPRTTTLTTPLTTEKTPSDSTSSSSSSPNTTTSEDVLSRINGTWDFIFSSSRRGGGAYMPEGATLTVDAKQRTVLRSWPVLARLSFIDWRGRVAPPVVSEATTTDADYSSMKETGTITARRVDVSPWFFSAFFEDRWRADVLFVNGKILALRSNTNDLLLFRRPWINLRTGWW